MKIHFMHCMQPSNHFGTRFKQDIEPAGFYFTPTTFIENNPATGWLSGTLILTNPIIIKLTSLESPLNWKSILHQNYKAKNLRLSRKLKKLGHDSILVQQDNHFIEGVYLYE